MEKDDRRREYIKSQNSKRFNFLKKVMIIYIALAIFIFVFGDEDGVSMFDKSKLVEFFPPFIFIFFIIIFIAIKKYKIAELCDNCGAEIKNIKKDCVVGKIKFLGTKEKTEYKNMSTTVTGKTVYPRGGYSMRNSVLEHISESTYEINQKVPVTKKYYVYNIEYRCKNCNAVLCNSKVESPEPLDIE